MTSNENINTNSDLNSQIAFVDEIIEIKSGLKSLDDSGSLVAGAYERAINRVKVKFGSLGCLSISQLKTYRVGLSVIIAEDCLKEFRSESHKTIQEANKAHDIAFHKVYGLITDHDLLNITSPALNYLCETLLSKARRMKATGISESDYHDLIVSNFDSLFSGLKFVESEVMVNKDDMDRVDILASHNKSGRDVIIELKLGNKSAHKQLRSYAVGFKRPILVNITESEVKHKRGDIIYITYDDIGIKCDGGNLSIKDNHPALCI